MSELRRNRIFGFLCDEKTMSQEEVQEEVQEEPQKHALGEVSISHSKGKGKVSIIGNCPICGNIYVPCELNKKICPACYVEHRKVTEKPS